jgi:acyl carrier protein
MPGNTNFVTVADRVKHIVVIQLQVSPNDVNPAADIETELGGDPLDKQEILMNLETEYNIVISDKDATNLHTVGDIISYIQKRTGSP